MCLSDAQEQIHTSPKNAPEWLKQCYTAIKDEKYKPQSEVLETIKNILEKQNHTEVMQNINMLNQFNTNLLWLASIYGKNKLVGYLTQRWGVNPKNLFEFKFVRKNYKLNIIKVTGFFATFADQAKHKGWIKKNIDPQTCFDYLETIVILAKEMTMALSQIKFTGFGKHIPFMGYQEIFTPKWLKDQLDQLNQLDELKKEAKTKKIERKSFFDVIITLGSDEENSTKQLYNQANCAI